MEWIADYFSYICAIFTGICTAWNIFDRIAERKPVALICDGSLLVSNPRRKSVYVRKIVFSGVEFAKKDGVRGDLIVKAGADVCVSNRVWQDGLEFIPRMKQVSLWRWDGFDVHVEVRHRKPNPEKK